MKQVVVCKEVEEYTSKLLKQSNLTIIFADSMSIKELAMTLSSDALQDGPTIILFDTSFTKFKKEHIDLINITKKNIVIVTDDEKKVPIGLRKICKVQNFMPKKRILPTTEVKSPMDVMGMLGKKGLDLDTLKKFPLGQLIKYLVANWEKFEDNSDVFLILEDISKKLYKVGDDYIYLYLLWGFPPQKRKTFFKWPHYKKKDTKESILQKIGEYYSYSMNETGKMWWLIRRIINNEMAGKYKLTDAERKLLGLKKKEKIVHMVNAEKLIRSKLLKSKSLLEI